MSSSHRKRRTLVAPEMNLSLDQSEGSLLSDDFLDTPDDLDINVDDIDTPDETDSLEFITNGNELEWEGKCFFYLTFLCNFKGSTYYILLCIFIYSNPYTSSNHFAITICKLSLQVYPELSSDEA